MFTTIFLSCWQGAAGHQLKKCGVLDTQKSLSCLYGYMNLLVTSWLLGKTWVRIDQSPVAPTSPSEGRDVELKGKHRATSDTE